MCLGTTSLCLHTRQEYAEITYGQVEAQSVHVACSVCLWFQMHAEDADLLHACSARGSTQAPSDQAVAPKLKVAGACHKGQRLSLSLAEL